MLSDVVLKDGSHQEAYNVIASVHFTRTMSLLVSVDASSNILRTHDTQFYSKYYRNRTRRHAEPRQSQPTMYTY